MPTDQIALLASAAGVGSFLLGRFLLRPSTGTTAPAADAPATPTSGASSGDSASLDFGDYGLGAGVLQGIDQGSLGLGGGGLPGGGDVTPPPASGGTSSGSTSSKVTIPGVAKPAGAQGIATAKGLKRLFRVTNGTATQLNYSGLTFSAYVGSQATYKPNSTLRKILTGTHAGLYVHIGDPGLTFTTNI